MQSFFYSIEAPESLKGIPEKFKKKLKKKTKSQVFWKLKNAKKKQKTSDVVLFFFPIVSRTGTDIDAALSNLQEPEDKSVIFVILHHTFDPEAVVSDSSKFVKRTNTCTVDCLFHEDNGLLKCKTNDEAFKKAKTFLKSVWEKKNEKQK